MSKFNRAEVVALLEALDFNTASKWDNTRMAEKLKGLPKIVDEETDLEDKGQKELLTSILAAVKAEKEITIVGDVDAAPAKGKKAPAAKAEKKEEDAPAKGKKAPAAKAAPAKAEKKEKVAKGPGVCQVIMDEFKKGSKENYITKEHVLKVLVKKFPERLEASMRSTVSASTSWMATWKGLKVYANKDGTGWYARD